MIERTVYNIVNHILSSSFGKALPSHDVAKVAVALRRKIDAMPVVLRFALTVLTHLFNWYGLVVGGKIFAWQGPEGCGTQIRQWQGSPLGLCREFLGFYEKMSVFIYLSLCPSKN